MRCEKALGGVFDASGERSKRDGGPKRLRLQGLLLPGTIARESSSQSHCTSMTTRHRLRVQTRRRQAQANSQTAQVQESRAWAARPEAAQQQDRRGGQCSRRLRRPGSGDGGRTWGCCCLRAQATMLCINWPARVDFAGVAEAHHQVTHLLDKLRRRVVLLVVANHNEDCDDVHVAGGIAAGTRGGASEVRAIANDQLRVQLANRLPPGIDNMLNCTGFRDTFQEWQKHLYLKAEGWWLGSVNDWPARGLPPHRPNSLQTSAPCTVPLLSATTAALLAIADGGASPSACSSNCEHSQLR